MTSYHELQNEKQIELNKAAYADDVGVIRAALAAGANPRWLDQDGWSALHSAVRGGALNALCYLADIIGEVDLVSLRPEPRSGYHEMTPLLLAVVSGQTSMIEPLLKLGANPNLRNARGWRPLERSCGRHPDILAIFLKNGIRPMSFSDFARDYFSDALRGAIAEANPASIWLLLREIGRNSGSSTRLKDHYFEHLPSEPRTQTGSDIPKEMIEESARLLFAAGVSVLQEAKRDVPLCSNFLGKTRREVHKAPYLSRRIAKVVDLRSIAETTESLPLDHIRLPESLRSFYGEHWETIMSVFEVNAKETP